MQKRKGFTLVELVIVIAVIAILAGVLIGTFASVLSKAQESARMQEMKAAEHEQKANDILEKLNNAQWFGWEDLETKIGTAVQTAIAASLESSTKEAIKQADLDATKVAIINAVDSAIAKYAQAAGQENTQLTAEQVKYIVEQAVSKSGGVTEAQVKAIVQSALQGVSTLSPAQVQRIVDTAANKVVASELTAADLVQALANVTNKNDLNTVLTAIENATKGKSTLTKEEVADIVSRYVKANGELKGDYTWYSKEKNVAMPATEAALQGLSVMSKNGETFKGQTIKITELLNDNAAVDEPSSSGDKVITLKDKWVPIQVFEGTLDGDGYTIENVNVDIVYWAQDGKGSTGTTYDVTTTIDHWYGAKKAFGFINATDSGAVIKNLTLNYSMVNDEDPQCGYINFGGFVGAVLGTTTFENVTIEGTIETFFDLGGITGRIYTEGKESTVTFDNVTLNVDLTTKDSENTYQRNMDHVCVGSIIGEVDGHGKGATIVVNNNCTYGEKNDLHNGVKPWAGTVIGRAQYLNLEKGAVLSTSVTFAGTDQNTINITDLTY